MLFYPSKTNNALNRRPFNPDCLTGRAMVNPVYPVDVCWGAQVICDSAAFQEVRDEDRVTPAQALDRQLRFEEQLRWRDGGFAHNEAWYFEAIVHYDQPLGVDEALIDGIKVKRRGTEETAQAAVDETLRAAAHYASQRDRVQGAIAYSAQGVSPQQYEACARELLALMSPRDWFAFGGFCIIGRMPRRMMPVFAATLERVMPLLKAGGVSRAHLLGVCYPPAILLAMEHGRRHGIQLSTDSSAPEMSGVMGRTYRDGRQQATYTRAQKYVDYHPCELALQNIKEYSGWAATL